MDNRHLKNRFSSYQYVKERIYGKAVIFQRPLEAIDMLIIKNNKDMMTNLQSSAFVARI
jgi:hypothetical protein